MVSWNIVERLMKSFPGSYINTNLVFIAHKKNQHFTLKDCESELDIKCKVIEWLSRAAFKEEPYESERSNREFHRFMLDGINNFLGANFDADDMNIIYTYLGNAIRHKETIQFVESGYDMMFFRRFEFPTY